MNPFHRTLLGLLMVLLLLVACNDQQQSVETGSNSAIDLDSLVDRLQAAGTIVELTGTVAQPFFSPQGQVITISGQDVQVFEYASKLEAKAESDLVASDGSSVGTSIMTWIATPHFYNSGKLIVLYVGDQRDTIDDLVAVLGTEFAGG